MVMGHIIVTGCAGFMGSHLADRLLADGHIVVGITSYEDHYRRAVKGANLEGARVNGGFTLHEANILDLAAEVPKAVYGSSSSIYGDQDQLSLPEDMALRPRLPNGVTKLAGEQLCGLCHANHGLDTVTLRFFAVYSPRQRPDMAFHSSITAMLEGREIVIYGDGGQTCDFTYVDEIVEGLVLAQEAPPAA
jgi:UDP-glucose 4-epimerase